MSDWADIEAHQNYLRADANAFARLTWGASAAEVWRAVEQRGSRERGSDLAMLAKYHELLGGRW